ncbi:hypothetical protein IEQ34_014322 [Dendrobium chrysotoxum]|uniref:UBX domain-containing protein n=1 Tax=Dendrobium chrysotoxum TaxID=161865 RepID=A0AAV7GJN1_DENCH|nr:hypothetical protein IEQ34_014322 [Dendrobium chrysotoxum]
MSSKEAGRATAEKEPKKLGRASAMARRWLPSLRASPSRLRCFRSECLTSDPAGEGSRESCGIRSGVSAVLVRFPTGERKERRFYSSTTVQALYDYVDSLDCLNAEKYSLVSNFPRVSYGPEKFSLSLKEAGLHPQASLFVEIES